jgi:DNA helicase-2/ATP-dependent DNA helicase PcrA
MAKIAGDSGWAPGQEGYKTLILEHLMAARRMGVEGLFAPLYRVERLKTGLMDGSLPELKFFTDDVLPLIRAMKGNDKYAAAAAVRRRSPLLDCTTLKQAGDNQIEALRQAQRASEDLMNLWKDGLEPTLLNVLRSVSMSGLFAIPETLRLVLGRRAPDSAAGDKDDDDDLADEGLSAWDTVMSMPFGLVEKYSHYVSGSSGFGTHQGIKGLQFPRVMIIDGDDEAGGFLFSYEKLFGVKEKSETDRKNESNNTETSIDRTRRLFYVTCSRAMSSLAVVAYSENPAKLKEQVIGRGWFDSNEVEVLDEGALLNHS